MEEKKWNSVVIRNGIERQEAVVDNGTVEGDRREGVRLLGIMHCWGSTTE